MLPVIIEYLLSRTDTSGKGLLVNQFVHETIIPVFPAGRQLVLATYPAVGDYANIAYMHPTDDVLVPGAFYIEFLGNGFTIFSNNWLSWQLHNSIDTFVIIKRGDATYARIRNITNADQYFAGLSFAVAIKSEETYNLVLEELGRVLGSSKVSENLASQANLLLTKMTGGR